MAEVDNGTLVDLVLPSKPAPPITPAKPEEVTEDTSFIGRLGDRVNRGGFLSKAILCASLLPTVAGFAIAGAAGAAASPESAPLPPESCVSQTAINASEDLSPDSIMVFDRATGTITCFAEEAALIDDFADADKKSTHGEKVESIMQESGDLDARDIRRYQAGSGGNLGSVVEAEAADLGAALDQYVEASMTGLLDGSSDAFEHILAQEDTQIKTVNQSLGNPEIRIAMNLHKETKDDADFRANYLEHAGLAADASESQLLQALVDDVSEAREGSDAIAESEQRYDNLTAQAQEQGITTVVSAGNYGRFADLLQREGVEVEQSFYQDVLVNDHVIAVGAVDSQGTANLGDDTEAKFTTPHASADISAPGVDVSVEVDGKTETGSGTSYSAPQVSGAIAEMKEDFPYLQSEEIEKLVLGTAADTGLNGTEVGAGILQEAKAQTLADMCLSPVGMEMYLSAGFVGETRS